jgi:hypothetical protein
VTKGIGKIPRSVFLYSLSHGQHSEAGNEEHLGYTNSLISGRRSVPLRGLSFDATADTMMGALSC